MKTYALTLLAAGASFVAAQDQPEHGQEPGNTPVDRLNTMNTALMNVTSSIEKLGSVVSGLTSENVADSLSPLLEASTATQDTITYSVEQVGMVDPRLDIIGALFLAQTTEHLGEVVKTTIDALINKKTLLDENMISPIVLDQLQTQQGGADNLTEAIKSKIPPEAGPVADELVGPVTLALQNGIAVFNGTLSPDQVAAASTSMSSMGTMALAIVAAVAVVAF